MPALIRVLGTALLAAALLVAPAPGAAPAATTSELIDEALAEGRIGPGRAALHRLAAVRAPQDLPPQFRSDELEDGTLLLLQARRALDDIESPALRRRVAEELSPRAASDSCDASDADKTTEHITTHFRIDYTPGDLGGGLDIDDYADALENAWSRHIAQLGWAEPPHKANSGDLLHVRLDALSSNIAGYVATEGTYAGPVGDNPSTSWNDVDAYASCMVLRDDYSIVSQPLRQLQGTSSHELHHMVQFGMGAPWGATPAHDVDAAFVEGGAKWIEDELVDIADRVHGQPFPVLSQPMGQYAASPYTYWLVFRAMTERYGTTVSGGAEDVMQRFWEDASRGALELPALGATIAAEGTTLGRAFHDAAVATTFIQPCGQLEPYPFCFEEAAFHMTGKSLPAPDATLALGDRTPRTVANDYAAERLALPTSGAHRVTIANTGTSSALRATVACDLGTSLRRVAVGDVLRPGDVGTAMADPQGCEPDSLVAVVSNAHVTSGNPTAVTTSAYEIATGDPAKGVVSVQRSGPGSVASTPAGIACGADCSHWYAGGTEVALTATPEAGKTFTGWSGACTGTETCAVTVDDAAAVTATFGEPPAPPEEDPPADDPPPAADPPPGSAPPPGPGPGPPPDVLPIDRTAPAFTRLSAPLRRLALFARRGLPVTLALSEPAAVTARLSVDRRTARRLGLRGRTLARRSVTPGTTRLLLRADRRTARRLRRLRRLRTTLTVTATDAAGNTAARTLRLTLRR